jgi:hypothetical protein
MADNSKDNPDAHFLPMGVMQMTSHPYPKKIIQTPSEVVINANRASRLAMSISSYASSLASTRIGTRVNLLHLRQAGGPVGPGKAAGSQL